MADLNTFRRNAKAMAEGEWINPGAEFGGIEIQCKALGFRYFDSVERKLKRAARLSGGEDQITSETRARINLESLIEECLLDVRNLTKGGETVAFAEFCELVLDPGYGELGAICFKACSMVGRQLAVDLQDAAKNSAPVSAQA
jgi:hypothetical protein